MTACNTQIITAFEVHGMAPEQIAEDMEMDIEAVKATLMQFSAQFRKAAQTDDKLNFNEQELIAANQVIAQIMQYSEDDNLRLRAARYIRDDKKGRLDATQMRGLNINAIQFNIRLQAARKSISESREKQVVLEVHEQKLLEAANKKVV